jgi:hypothetical protein
LEKKDRGVQRTGGLKEAKPGSRPAAHSVQGDVGNALRSAYEQTVGENIPSEMLDLLGKLA